METIQINKEAIIDLVRLKDEFDRVIESLELMSDSEFMKSYKKSKEQIKNREFDDWNIAQKFNVIIEQGEDGYLISEVVELPGCHTQAKTMDQLLKRAKEAISLYLKAKKILIPLTKFLGLQQIEIGA